MNVPVESSYTEARQKLAKLLDRVSENREVVYIRRRGRSRVALIAADDLSGLLETAYLLRSPRNARRLLAALRRATRGTGKPESLASLKRRIGLASEA